MTEQERRELFMRSRSSAPIYQLLGLFGLNPYQSTLDNLDQLKTDRKRAEIDQSLVKLLQQLQNPNFSLFNTAANLSLGSGAQMLSAAAGMGGIAGSGLQALGASKLTSDVLGSLAQQISADRLQRQQLAGGIIGQRSNLFLTDQELQKRYAPQDDQNSLTKILYALAYRMASGGIK